MAKLFLINKGLYYRSQVAVVRGDQWNIAGKIVDSIGGVNLDVDLTGAGVTGYFPPATGTSNIAVVASITNAKAGEVLVVVTPEKSVTIAIESVGIAPYLAVSGTGDGPYTVQTPDSALIVSDPGFELTT